MYTRIKNFLQEKYKYWKVYYRKFSLERNSGKKTRIELETEILIYKYKVILELEGE